MPDPIPLETMTLACIFCGDPEVVMAVQKSPAGKICGLVFVCRQHMVEADKLVILKPKGQ